MKTPTMCAAAALALWLLPARAAGDDAKPKSLQPGIGLERRKDELVAGAALGATLSVNDNRNVVGQTDGTTATFGYKLDSAMAVVRGQSEVRGTLFVAQSLTKAPNIAPVLKSQDALRFELIYLYHALPWLGPYARAAGDGPMLAGFDDRPAPVDYLVSHLDGTTTRVTGTHLRLTDMFRPYTLSQSLGLFLRPLERESVNLELRVGGAARETFANGQRAVADDPATPEIEVKDLETFHQLGVDAAAAAWGKLNETVLYKAGVEAMVPFYRTETVSAAGKSAAELTNVLAFATVSFKLASFATVDYDLRVVRQPQLLDKTQVQNHLLLTFGIIAGTEPKK